MTARPSASDFRAAALVISWMVTHPDEVLAAIEEVDQMTKAVMEALAGPPLSPKERQAVAMLRADAARPEADPS